MNENIAGYLAGCHALSEQDPIAAGRNLDVLATMLEVYDVKPTDPQMVVLKPVLEKVAMESCLMFAQNFYERDQPDIAAELLELAQEHANTLGVDISVRVKKVIARYGN